MRPHSCRQVAQLFRRKFRWQNECPISLRSERPISIQPPISSSVRISFHQSAPPLARPPFHPPSAHLISHPHMHASFLWKLAQDARCSTEVFTPVHDMQMFLFTVDRNRTHRISVTLSTFCTCAVPHTAAVAAAFTSDYVSFWAELHVRTASHRLKAGRRANKGTQCLLNLPITRVFINDTNYVNYFYKLNLGATYTLLHGG
jgi:hypothetical protein